MDMLKTRELVQFCEGLDSISGGFTLNNYSKLIDARYYPYTFVTSSTSVSSEPTVAVHLSVCPNLIVKFKS